MNNKTRGSSWKSKSVSLYLLPTLLLLARIYLIPFPKKKRGFLEQLLKKEFIVEGRLNILWDNHEEIGGNSIGSSPSGLEFLGEMKLCQIGIPG